MRCRDAAAGSLTDRRSLALSPVDGPRALVTAGFRGTHRGPDLNRAKQAVSQRHRGCISNQSKTTDNKMVHQ